MLLIGKYPSMLAPQLVGRLLSEAQPEQEHNDNVCKLLIQCDIEGPMHNALVPTYHCLHTPGPVAMVTGGGCAHVAGNMG